MTEENRNAEQPQSAPQAQPEEMPAAFEGIGRQPATLEAVVQFACEVSVLLVRSAAGEIRCDSSTLLARQIAFGYTREDLDVLLLPAARDGKEPVGSMGNDTPPAVLSDRPQLLFNYFKQYFAQVTNPPIDPIREELVMSLTTFLGREANILEETPEHARRLKLFSPILTDENLGRIQRTQVPDLRPATLDTTFAAAAGAACLEPELQRLCREAEAHAAQSCTILILSDRATGPERAPLPVPKTRQAAALPVAACCPAMSAVFRLSTALFAFLSASALAFSAASFACFSWFSASRISRNFFTLSISAFPFVFIGFSEMASLATAGGSGPGCVFRGGVGFVGSGAALGCGGAAWGAATAALLGAAGAGPPRLTSPSRHSVARIGPRISQVRFPWP